MVEKFKKKESGLMWCFRCFLCVMLLVSTFCPTLDAQDVDSIPLIIPEVSDSVLLSEKRNVTTRWFLIDFGWNRHLQKYGNVNQSYYDTLALKPWSSIHIGVNVFRQRISLYKHQLNLEYGFALQFDRFTLNRPYSLSPYSSFVTPEYVYQVTLKRNQLNLTSLSIPLLIQYEMNPLRMKKSLHLAAGGYFGVIMGAKQKQKTNDGEKISVKGNFNLSNIRYGLRGELGFSYLTFFAKWDLQPFFIQQQDLGYGLNTVTFGIRLIPFF